ncbi:MAG: hypothetical protein KTR14_04250 [Vampirovibrio sp.]|nr:hypothetical protein [Vampirovibrio sp.]
MYLRVPNAHTLSTQTKTIHSKSINQGTSHSEQAEAQYHRLFNFLFTTLVFLGVFAAVLGIAAIGYMWFYADQLQVQQVIHTPPSWVEATGGWG